MTTNVILVNLAALATIVWIVWYFWLSEKPRSVAVLADGGVQEVYISVRGGYDPNLIVLSSHRPARLHFTRRETASCSEVVTFPDFDISRRLPVDEDVTIGLDEMVPGEYDFACQMGMLRGKLVVTDGAAPPTSEELG